MIASFVYLGCVLAVGSTVVTSASIPRDNENEVESRAICDSDFVEKFFRLLSGPVGKEAEALVASVLKLLSESDRVHVKSLFSKDDDTLNRDIIKRLQPKFNPTGWRRKRDATQSNQWNSFIQSLYGSLSHDRAAKQDERELSQTWPKRSPWSSTGRRYQYIDGAFKLKRKPLKFNPTGW